MRRKFYLSGPVDGAWINMVLVNGFTAGTATPQYMKDSRGVVHLRGIVLNPDGAPSNGPCWTAPVGYRPAAQTGSLNYYDFPNGGSNFLTPSRMVQVAPEGQLYTGRTSSNTGGVVSHPCAIDRIHWQT